MGEKVIAYNYYIKFIPEIKMEKSAFGTFENIITIKESVYENWKNDLTYQWTFFNNQGRDIALYTNREFSRTLYGQSWAFDVKDVATFFWTSGSLTLSYDAQEYFTSDLLEYWSLHIVLPIFLTIEERYDFLHAGAVEVKGSPILFVAESFGGKSTMTDFFIKQNHPMISDDKVALREEEGGFLAISSHPHHRPYRKMEDLGYFVENMAHDPKPIHAIYELDRAAADADISITELSGIEKFKTLRFSSEINLSFLKSKRFDFLSNLARQVPVYKVTVPWDMERLNEVHDAICEHSNH